VGALDGQTALIAGGASGIGRATVELLASEGAAVVIADMQAGLGSELATRVGGRFIQTDVTDFGSWEALVATVGPVDIVSLNPGVTTGERDLARLTVQQYGRVMAINVDAVVFGLMAVLPGMLLRGGTIIVLASIAGIVPVEIDPIFALSKHALIGLVRSAAPQLAERGVKLNVLCHRVVDTALVAPEAKAILEHAGFDVMTAHDAAGGVLAVVLAGEAGQIWLAGRGKTLTRYEFPAIPLATRRD
jgi:NAD(P)-dependent dehydrogenase (short-subunit alcohol dehydrogenase family)